MAAFSSVNAMLRRSSVLLFRCGEARHLLNGAKETTRRQMQRNIYLCRIMCEKDTTSESKSDQSASLSYDDMLIKSAKEEFAKTNIPPSNEHPGDNPRITRTQILDAALLNVKEHGWSVKAIASASQELGLSSAVEDMFPRGGGDLVLHFIEDSNQRLSDHMQLLRKQLDADTPTELSVDAKAFVRDAIEVRLRMNIPYMSNWSSAMSLMLLPQNATEAVENVANMADEIWYQAGDISTDMDWYSKRVGLAAVYGATELYMTTDNSEDYKKTWEFLESRLDNVEKLEQAKQFLSSSCDKGYEGLSTALSTIRNMAGFDRAR